MLLLKIKISKFKRVYDEIEDTLTTQPNGINPIIKKGSFKGEKYFNMYKEKYGDFNLFLPYDKDNIYGWFDGHTMAFDKESKTVEIPL